jgi:hypothetical protein
MNNNLILISTILALSLSGVGCNKSGKLAQHSTFTQPSGPVELKLKWPKGERITQDMDMKQTAELSVPGRPVPIKQDITLEQEYGLTVLDETPDGGHEVEMEILSARVGVTIGGMTLPNYDSAKKSTADKANPVAKLFGKIIGSKVQFFLNASNGVERIEGADALAEMLASGGRADQLEDLKNLYSEGNLKQMMSANLFMPPKAVQPGDTWPVHIEFPMGALSTMVVDDHFTFQNWEMQGERNCARLEFQGTITNKPDTNANPNRMSVSITNGEVSGVSWFDPGLGITIDTTMNLNLNMVITVPMHGRGNLGAAVRMQNITDQMNQTITMKLISVK